MKKIIIVLILLAIIATGGVVALKTKSALADNSDSKSLVSQLAEKLGLDQTKVSTAMNEVRQNQQQQQIESKLNEAVKNGVINEEQKQKLLEKQIEVMKKREQENQEMQQWMSDNGLDAEKLQQYLGPIDGFGHGMRMGNGMGK